MQPFGQRLTLGLLTTVTLEVVPFRPYALFPVPLPFFKCILEILLYDSASIVVSKWQFFSFLFD
jgi:hypothetical protein